MTVRYRVKLIVLGTITVQRDSESSLDFDISDSRLPFPRRERDVHGWHAAVSALQKHEGVTRAHLAR